MKTKNKLTENDVFKQFLSSDEMKSVGGGISDKDVIPFDLGCTSSEERWIYTVKFPNCAATVEDNSWCSSADACTVSAVIYKGMDACVKAHF